MNAGGDDQELASLFAADQAARQRYLADGSLPEVGDDAVRCAAVRQICAEGRLRTARDYYHAAMVLHHGKELADHEEAHRFALEAARRGEDEGDLKNLATWLVAATWDRCCMSQGKAQWYGTQFVRDERQDLWVLYPLDRTAVSDADRRRMNVPEPEEVLARLNQTPNSC